MTHINVKISKAVATAEKDGIITAGMVGVPVSFMFDSWWDGLIVTAVFKGSGAPISVPLLGATDTVVPWEVLKRPSTLLRIGAEGRLPDGTLVIPTTWATVGIVTSGANATDDLAKPPTPTAFDRIMSQIGNMNDLATEDKSSLVAAVNEAMEKGGGVDVSGASVGQIIKVAAVDDTGKPTAWEPADLPEQAQSDWEQNDAEQPNYVKNRPFYEKIDSVTLMPETQFSNLTHAYNPEISIPSDVNGEYIVDFTIGKIFEGDPVKVTFNGTVYECIKKGYYIGNQSLTGYDGVEDTGEPFLFYLGGISSFHTKSTDCVVKVDADISSIKKLDSKFIDFPFIEGTGADSIIFNSIDKTSGYMNEASGKGSFASGYFTEATGEYSHAEGEFSKATGKSSHAEGFDAKANGKFSHAECINTEANGSNSHAEGNGTVANGECQHSQGKYNIIDTDGKYLHIVGNGTDDDKRSNAHTLDWRGNAWFAGDVKVGGTEWDDIAAKTLATTEDIPVVDGTLTKSSQAADAAVVGDLLSALSEEIVTTSESKVAAHNTGTDTHSDIRLLIQGLTDRLNALADSDDTTLDQLSEVVAYIKSNRSLIEAITTGKVSVADIVDNLTTNVANKPLSAAQGVIIKTLIDALRNDKLDAAELTNAINTALAQAKASGEFDGADGYTPARGTDYWTASDKAEVVAEAAAAIDLTSYAKKTEVPTKTSQLTNDSGFLTSHQDISGKQDKATLEADVAANGFTKNTGTYSKPAGGIPKADLAASVQTSLGKADTALQEHQSLAAYRTAAAQDVIDSGKVDKVEGKGLSTNDYTDAAKAKVDAIPAVDSTLTVSGAAADAKKTGTRISAISEELDNFIASGGFSAPIVESVDEMVDTSKQYILKSTGTIWAYKSSTTEQEVTVTDTITATDDNPYKNGNRFGSSGDTFSSDAAGYHVTPLIDLTKPEYAGKTIQLHLEGVQYSSTGTFATWIQCRPYGTNMTVLSVRPYTVDSAVTGSIMQEVAGISVAYNSATSTTITVTILPTWSSAKTPVGYIRFCGKGAVADSNIYITYQTTETVTSEQWVDTGIQYGGGGLDAETAAKISELNNEGNSPSTIKLLPKPVLDFYNAVAYSDSDYSYSHLEKITYPCRADIPVPFTVKWEYNEDAMRTTVAVDTRAIGTVNAYTLRTYDATGFNKFPIYNLLPNKTYYYKVTHVMADGSLVEAKSGSFTTSSEAWRLLYIDGTQNVRDLGGWTGLNGKKVKYGKIIRGAAFSDSSIPELLLTGKGRRSLGELAIQAELNLGAADTETSIAANCVYKKIYYTNYAIAFTGETYRAQFKEVLEWIVEQLTASKPIYMHCQGGCDRTATLAFQLLGLLGVSESDLAKEYELSSFSNIGFGRLRTTTKAVDTYDYVGMVEALKAYSGDTVVDKFYDFATTGCGISEDTITNFRNLMLE